MSGTYQSAYTAARNTSGANISVIDGRSMSVGLGLVIEKMAEIIKTNNLNHDEAVLKLEEIIKNTQIFTAVRDLSYAVKGGRVPKIIQKISNILNKDLSSFIVNTREGYEVWRYLLWILCFMVIIEMLLSNVKKDV